MNHAQALEAVSLLEGSFTRYKETGAAAVIRWLERSQFGKADVAAVIDARIEAGEKFPPKPGELLQTLRELGRIPVAAPGFGDPRLIAAHMKSIRETALTISRLRGITFRQAVERQRDEQRTWLEEGIEGDYLDTHDRGWHRDRIAACVQVIVGEDAEATA